MANFEKHHVSKISKDLIENYINQKDKKHLDLLKIYFCLLELY